jgi:hypothetical protein
MTNPAVKEIVRRWLRAYKYTGLVYRPDKWADPNRSCECFLDDLAPCGSPSDACKATKRKPSK